jgi:predicted transport protein
MEKGLQEKTGKSLAEWIAIVKAEKLDKHGAILKYLKSEHGMTHGFANFVSLKARASDAGSHAADNLVDAQYSKGKEHLRPILEAILQAVKGFGDDVEVAPKKANVSLRRKRQFALVQPSTKTRIDLGLKYKEAPDSERILGSGSFGTMCSNRVQLTSVDDVDQELIAFLKAAYEQAG